MKKFLLITSIFLLVFGSAGGASALLVTFDFTGGSGNTVNDATFTGSDGSTTVFADEVPSSDFSLYLGSTGLGVLRDWGSDSTQVDGWGTNEFIRFTFSQAVALRSASFASVTSDDDFAFYAGDSGGNLVLLSSSTDIPNSNTYNFVGSYLTDLYMIGAMSINDDFYISGLTADVAASVPEPATMLILGLGLVGLATTQRKKFFKK